MILTMIKSHFLSDRAFPGRVSAMQPSIPLPIVAQDSYLMAAQLHSAFPGSPPWFEVLKQSWGLEAEAGSLWVQEVMAAGRHEREQRQSTRSHVRQTRNFKFNINYKPVCGSLRSNSTCHQAITFGCCFLWNLCRRRGQHG